MATKINEIRARFISALRLRDLTKSEWRLVVTLNDLYNPEVGKAWAGQEYLSSATGLPIRTLYKATRGLVQKGIIWADTVRLSYHMSKLEYRMQYNKVIASDPGYPKRPKRPRIEMAPAQTGKITGTNGEDYRHKQGGLPAQRCHQSSLVSSLGPSLEHSLEGSALRAPKRNSIKEGKSDESVLEEYKRKAGGGG